MINNEEFAGRLNRIMDFYQLSASAFADRIQVPRSSISHLLSGRNKPSLDFVLKVTRGFKEVELYWLLNGKGVFPPAAPERPSDTGKTNKPAQQVDEINAPEIQKSVANLEKKLEKIVLFYTDGTFREFHP